MCLFSLSRGRSKQAPVAELVDARDLKSLDLTVVPVRVRPGAPVWFCRLRPAKKSEKRFSRIRIFAVVLFSVTPFNLLSAGSIGDAEFVPFLTGSDWAVSKVGDPTGLAPEPLVERFELRTGDCISKPPYDDCRSGVERAELAQKVATPGPSSQVYWYRWKVFFPEDFVSTYPARNRHGQFIDQATGESGWVFEIGSTGALWIGSRFDEESRFFSLASERDLRGRWHDLVVEAIWSDSDGKLNVWINDEQRAMYRGPTCTRCRVFLSYGISRVGVDKFKERYPQKSLPNQMVYYLPVEIRSEDPGWIVRPPPVPETEVDAGPDEVAEKDEIDGVEKGVSEEESSSSTVFEGSEEGEEVVVEQTDSESVSTLEEVTILPEPEPEPVPQSEAEAQAPESDTISGGSEEVLELEQEDTESDIDADSTDDGAPQQIVIPSDDYDTDRRR